MIEKTYSFAVDSIEELNLDEYPSDEFAVVRIGFLSDAPNAHKLDITEEVLRNNADTALGKFVVAKILLDDAMAHEADQDIFGYVPREQDIVFTLEKNYIRASCIGVISKYYAEDFCKIIERDGVKSVSVEMTIVTPDDDPHKVLSFRVFGITVLGERFSPSCPDSSIELIKFSTEKAEDFYNKVNTAVFFAENREEQEMAEKATYKVDKSQEAMSTKPWGDVDKAELRKKIMESSNRDSLVKDVYMLVEDGWVEAPSEHLKYPVMCFEGDTLVYNRDGLASALGYAKKEGEKEVISKVEKIYKKLGLDYEGKEEETKMTKEIEFAIVDIGDMWSRLFMALHSKYPDGGRGSIYEIEGIYEERNKKFAIICRRDEEVKYRLDFSLTEEGLELADEIIKVEIEIVETDEVRKFAEPDNVEEYKSELSLEVSEESMEEKVSRLESEIESRDNIIMEKDKELEELRRFKEDIEEREKTLIIEAVMSEVKDCLEESKFTELREEAKLCTLESIDAWSNKVKALAFSIATKRPKKQNFSGVFEFAAPTNGEKPKPVSVWDRLKEQI